MSSLLKDIYSSSFFDRLSESLSRAVPGFQKHLFLEQVLTEDFQGMELKARMRHIAQVLHAWFPADYGEAVVLLERVIHQLRTDHFADDRLEFMFLPAYIETFGLDHFQQSIKAIEFTTQFVSCEYTVRPFLLNYKSEMLDQMTAWSLHNSHKVRRLASEGSRPRLPWAMAIPELKRDPAPVLPILENLKEDPSEWVRRSVANNLNDISKDHPALVLDIVSKWKNRSKATDAIIKHGCRTMLKQGHPSILKHYGLKSENIILQDFQVFTPRVHIGESLAFTFTVVNSQAVAQLIRIEYAVYYLKQNGQSAKKVFKISERTYAPYESAMVQRKQSFRRITTRKFYAGLHSLSIVLNGEEKAVAQFELLE